MIKAIRIILGGLVILTVSYFISCKKANQPADFIDTKATISLTGAVASDGCGYVITINSTAYHAENLPSDYSVDKLNVVVSAKITVDKFQCGLSPNSSLPVIHIISITKQ